MSSIKPGEVRYFKWGNEPAGAVSTWTVKDDRSVKLLGIHGRKRSPGKKAFYGMSVFLNKHHPACMGRVFHITPENRQGIKP
jgi:hypothetical protein